MALLAEYALTPGVFDVTAYTSEEVCGLHLQALKDVLLHEGIVRNLRSGDWVKTFDDSSRPWHQRGKELLKKLRTQQRIVLADAAVATVAALTPAITTAARTAGLSVEVFLWDDIHDRYLITDLIGIGLQYGFGTTTKPNAQTTWHRLGRSDRDSVQREFDPAHRQPRHRFTVKGT